MAKKRSRPSRQARRVVSTNARRSLLGLSTYPTRRRLGSLPLLTLASDNRRWHPESPFQTPRTLSGTTATIGVSQARPRSSSRRPVPSWTLAYTDPYRVLTCIRRKARREVIHARGVAGTKVRNPRRTRQSSISCRG